MFLITRISLIMLLICSALYLNAADIQKKDVIYGPPLELDRLCVKRVVEQCIAKKSLEYFADDPIGFLQENNVCDLPASLQQKIISEMLSRYKHQIIEKNIEAKDSLEWFDVIASAFSYDGSQMALRKGNKIRVFDQQSKKQLHCLEGHTDDIEALVYNRDGSQLASGSWDRTIRIWNPHSGTQLHQLGGQTDRIWALAYNHNGSQLASGSLDGTVRVWDSHSGVKLRQFDKSVVMALDYNHNGSQLALAFIDGKVDLLNPHNGDQLRQLDRQKKMARLMALAYNREGSQLALGFTNGKVELLDPHNGDLVAQLDGEYGCLEMVLGYRGYSPDGSEKLAAGYSNGKIHRWVIPDYSKLVSELDIKKALYIYKILQEQQEEKQESELNENKVVQEYFAELHESLPEMLKKMLNLT